MHAVKVQGWKKVDVSTIEVSFTVSSFKTPTRIINELWKNDQWIATSEMRGSVRRCYFIANPVPGERYTGIITVKYQDGSEESIPVNVSI